MTRVRRDSSQFDDFRATGQGILKWFGIPTNRNMPHNVDETVALRGKLGRAGIRQFDDRTSAGFQITKQGRENLCQNLVRGF